MANNDNRNVNESKEEVVQLFQEECFNIGILTESNKSRSDTQLSDNYDILLHKFEVINSEDNSVSPIKKIRRSRRAVQPVNYLQLHSGANYFETDEKQTIDFPSQGLEPEDLNCGNVNVINEINLGERTKNDSAFDVESSVNNCFIPTNLEGDDFLCDSDDLVQCNDAKSGSFSAGLVECADFNSDQKSQLVLNIVLNNDEKHLDALKLTTVTSEESKVKTEDGTMTVEHNTQRYVCAICEREFKRNDHLLQHARMHTGARPYRCNLCKQDFPRDWGLRCHMKRKHGATSVHIWKNKPEQFRKIEKSKETRRKRNNVSCLKGKPKPPCLIRCRVCDIYIKGTVRYVKHMTHDHPGHPPFQCETCEGIFTCRSSLLAHAEVHTSGRSFECEVCGKSYAAERYLRGHQRRTHGDNQRHVCDVCGKGFASRVNLRMHSAVHTGARDYLCTLCGKCYAQPATLAVHLKMHAGKRDHKCPICGKTYIVRSRLREHQLTHMDYKPHTCETCGKAFAKRAYLVAHQRTHTGYRPYPCLETDCKRRFASLKNLRVHQKKHLSPKTVLCVNCNRIFSSLTALRRHERKEHRPPAPPRKSRKHSSSNANCQN